MKGMDGEGEELPWKSRHSTHGGICTAYYPRMGVNESYVKT